MSQPIAVISPALEGGGAGEGATQLETKYCPRCEKGLELSNFYISKAGKVRSYCKACSRELCRLSAKQTRTDAPDKLKSRAKDWYHTNRERVLAERREQRKLNAQKVNEAAKEWRAKNPDKQREISKRAAEKHKDRNKIWRRNYQRRRKDELREQRNGNPNLRIGATLRKYLIKKLKGTTKSAATLELLGCSIPELRAHLEAQFKPNMSWDNYGLYGWHIDHIRPCASFDLTDPAQQRQCFHYSNLQPLWAVDNLKKGATLL